MRVALAARLAGGVGVYSQTLVRALATADPELQIHLLTPDPVPDDVAARVAVRPVALRRGLPTHPGWLLEALGFREPEPPGTLDLIHFTDARQRASAPVWGGGRRHHGTTTLRDRDLALG
jgi:hypothetical protein